MLKKQSMKKDIKKVIKIIVFCKNIDGGTGTFILSLMNIYKFFSKNQINIIPCIIEKPALRKISLYQTKNINFHREKNSLTEVYSFSLNTINYLFKDYMWIKKQIAFSSAQFIISVDVYTNILVLIISLFSLIHKIPIMIVTQNNLKMTLLNKAPRILYFFLKVFIKILYETADIVVCVSKKLRNHLHTEFLIKKRIITIYNGVSLPKQIEEKIFKKTEKKIIVSIGRFVEQKDFITLIFAFKKIIEKYKNTHLKIIGHGPEKEKLVNLVKKLHLNSFVSFPGWKNHVKTYLEKADIFVHSSRREGFPFVLIEAVSYGLPIIATDTPYGPSEILGKGKFGILVPIGDVNKMQDAVIKLLTNSSVYTTFAKHSIKRRFLFSEEKMLTSYSILLKKHLFPYFN